MPRVLAALALTFGTAVSALAGSPCESDDIYCLYATRPHADMQQQIDTLRTQLLQQRANEANARRAMESDQQRQADHQSFQRTERWMEGMQPKTFLDSTGHIQTFQPLIPQPY